MSSQDALAVLHWVEVFSLVIVEAESRLVSLQELAAPIYCLCFSLFLPLCLGKLISLDGVISFPLVCQQVAPEGDERAR